MADFKTYNVTSVPDGTLVVYRNQDDWKEPGPRIVVFSDSNGNQKLDAGDLKLAHYIRSVSGEKQCKPGYDGTQDNYYCVTKVNKADIKEFGKRTDRLFRSSQVQRKQLLRLLKKKSFAKGSCSIDVTLSPRNQITNCRHGDTKFDPPLSLRTRSVDKKGRSSKNPTGTLKKGDPNDLPTFDPRQCLVAEVAFKAVIGGRNITINFKVGGQTVLLGYHGTLQRLGLSNALDIPDVFLNAFDNSHDVPHHRAHLDLGDR